jgi:hypothetical protein
VVDEPEPREAPPEAAGGRFGASIRNADYLPKWLLLGLTIGVISGLGAVVFYLALKYTGEFLLGYLAGYRIPTPLGEGGSRGSAGFTRPWAIPLVTTGGALLSALIVAKLAPEATGHGTDEAIEAVHTNPRAIRGRAVLVKMVASALTIGSGGSGGREGPTAHISAGFCSLLTRRLNLSDEDGRTAVALGIGAGIGAIFAAPLGGAVLAASITYRDDFDYRSLLPGFITAGTAYAVLGSFLGFEPLFGYIDAEYRFERAGPLLWFVAIGVIAAAVGYLYARTFHASVALVRRLPGGTGRVIGRTAGTGDPANLEQRLRMGATGRRPRLADDDSAVDHPSAAGGQDHRDVLVHRHRRLRWPVRTRHRDRCIRRGRDLAVGGPCRAARSPRATRHLRGGRNDDVLWQRRPRPAGGHDHGRGDDGFVLGGPGSHPGRGCRIVVDVADQRHHLRGATPRPRNCRGRARPPTACRSGLVARRAGGILFVSSPLVGQLSAGTLQMRPDEPLELLQVPGLADQ